MSAASGVFKISLLSCLSCTFNANLNLELDQIWSSTTPDGFCVASIKWIPNERPIRAVDTSSFIKSGCSDFNSANSSEIMNKWLTSCSPNKRWRFLNSALIDVKARIASSPSKFVIVPTKWTKSLNKFAIPPPL